MDEPGARRCPHYQLYAQPLGITDGPNLLAVRHCMLSERLSGLLAKTPDGHLLTNKLLVRIHSEKDYAVVGPDLEAVAQAACTVQRCEAQCTPAYGRHIKQFGATDPHLDEVTCNTIST